MKKYFIFCSLFSSNYIFASAISSAVDLYHKGDFFQAKDEIEKAKKKDTPKYWYYRGVIFHKLFKTEILSDDASSFFKESIKSYREVEKFKNKQFISYANKNLNELFKFLMQRGNMYVKMENYQDALIFFQRANEIEKENAETLRNIAIVYQKLGDNKKALRVFKNQKSDNILFACNQVKFLLKEKKNRQALNLIKKLITEHPYNTACIESFFIYLSKQSQSSQKKTCEEILSKDEKTKRYQQAVLAQLQGDFKSAYETFSKLYEEDKDIKILIQLCDVGYCYSQQLIKISNEDIEDEDKYNYARDVINNTILLTEKIFKKYNNNVEVIDHLYRLYMQSEQQEKAATMKSKLKRLGVEYICNE